MLHLGCRPKNLENPKHNNERYEQQEKQEMTKSYDTSLSSTSSKIVPNRSIKLKPIQNSNTQIFKVNTIGNLILK